MTLANHRAIPMKTIRQKLKQVASGMGLAGIFLLAGMAMGGPVELLSTTNVVPANVEVCAPDAASVGAAVEQATDARAAVRSAMRMPYFSFGRMLPRASILSIDLGS